MSLINKKQNTLTQTIGHSPICIKSTCLICKRFDNNENHIKYNEYYLCKSCFIIKDIHVLEPKTKVERGLTALEVRCITALRSKDKI